MRVKDSRSMDTTYGSVPMPDPFEQTDPALAIYAMLGLHAWPSSATAAAQSHLAVLMLGSVRHSLVTGS